MQTHAALGAHQWAGSDRAPRGRPSGGASRTGLGVHPLRAPGPGLLRSVDLRARPASQADAATADRLERLQQVLHERVRRDIDASPPLLRAGVLIPLLWRGHGLEMLLTRRTDTVLTHKGQISFPGGQREDADAETIETALRESYEEIGLDPSRVTVLGELDDVFTAVSSFVITPVVGLVQGEIDDLRLAPDEVRSLLIVPVDRLLDPRVHTSETRSVGEQQYRIHYYTIGDDVIWGATGRIVYQFLKAWEEAA
ncbi:MAG: CoA pyrophosphatase [Chloroflexi bacterium]|nr:MAG: CoA pyrophosphatase [Chloroflexota bacterium]TMD66228.1 MAG: CoA pyrophosphatase [Chloroflexota bacterium]